MAERTQGASRRVGIIVALTHADGSPPYRVRWLDTGRESFVFPATDAHIEPPTPRAEPWAGAITSTSPQRKTQS